MKAIHQKKNYFYTLCFMLFAAIQVQGQAIKSGVAFNWADTQSNLSDPATLRSITIDGFEYNTFVVPSSYELTRLGPAGHNFNNIQFNGSNILGNSNASNWTSEATRAYQSLNLNHYFRANDNGDNFCGNLSKVATTDAQIQTIRYSPGIPSNPDGVIAITERGGNNCFFIELYGTPVGGGPEQLLGSTFITSGRDLRGVRPQASPTGNSDYWSSGRNNENNQIIGIALFKLSSLAPTGSTITSIRYHGATRDHGDGKFFLMQTYAVGDMFDTPSNTLLNANVSTNDNAPVGSTYSLETPPSSGTLNLNSDGSFTYTSDSNFVGTVDFSIRLCLPSPNQAVCDVSTVTITVTAPEEVCDGIDNDFDGDVDEGLNCTIEVSIDDASATEGNILTYTLNAGQSRESATNFNISYNNISTLNSDYNGPGSVILPANATSVSFDVLANDDDLIEFSEQFEVILAADPAEVVFTDDTGLGTIMDNDAVSGTGLDFDSTNVTVDEAAGTATFTVRLTGNVPGGFTVDYATADGSAIAGNDYTTNSGTLAFAGNDNETQDITVSITDDALIETTEGYVVDLSGLSTTLIGINTPQANGNITDNDSTDGYPMDITVDSCDDIPSTDTITIDRLCDVTLVHSTDVISGDADACPSEYTITRTWTVTNCNAFTSEHVQIITVLDRDNPEFVETLPANTTASCDTVPMAALLTATDNCNGVATVDFNEEIINQDASCPNNYQIIRTWTATDCAGNTALHTQTVTVTDTEAPTFVESLPQSMTVSCDFIPEAEVLSAQDNCDSNVAVTYTETITNDANCQQGYTITRIWSAMDCSGNEVKHTQILTIPPSGPITVSDYDDEVTISCGDDIPEVPELEFMGGCGDYQVVFNQVEEFSDTSDDYMIIRSWDVTDACGNTARFEQIIFVLQPKLEEISIVLCVEDAAVDLASYLPSSFDSNGTFTIDGSTAEVPNGNFDPSLFELGTYTILYSAARASCNYLAEFTIEVNADCVPCSADQLEFSKTITANGDGKNDVFEIKGAEFCDYIFEVQIFNRWGNIVYQSNDYQNDWNAVAPNSSFGNSGTVPSGTYYYIVNVKNSDLKTINGFLYIGAN